MHALKAARSSKRRREVEKERREEKRLLEKSSLSPAVPPPLTHMAYPAEIAVQNVAKHMYDVAMTAHRPFPGLFLLRTAYVPLQKQDETRKLWMKCRP